MLKFLSIFFGGHLLLKTVLRRRQAKIISTVIFDKDNRVNVTEALIKTESDPKLIANQRATFIMVDVSNLKLSEDQTYYDIQYNVEGQTLQQLYNLCDKQKFGTEKLLGFCSGIAIDNKKALTAGHCISQENLSNIALVFDFRVNDNGEMPTKIPAKNVVFPTSISAMAKATADDISRITPPIDSFQDTLDRAIRDYAILNVDGEFPYFVPLQTIGNHTVGTGIYSIGYPFGLAQKMGSGTVKYSGEKGFYSNLDSFSGNSGAPVFEKETHNLAGIHITGVRKKYPDFSQQNGETCYRYAVYETDAMTSSLDLAGEINIEEFLPFL